MEPVALAPLKPPWRLAASAIDPEISTISKPKTVRPLTDTFLLKTCISSGSLESRTADGGLRIDCGFNRP